MGGVLGGLLGVGGGFVMVPLLVLWGGLTQHRANGTSLAAIIPIALAGALVYYFRGGHPAVDLPFGGLLVLGSVAGAYAGARAAGKIPERQLQVGVALLLAAVGLKELFLP